MLALLNSLSTSLTAITLIFLTCAYVIKVARQVAQWVKGERIRNSAVDAVTADWKRRGITPEGAIAEGARFRDRVDNHESAIADTKRRVDGVEVRLGDVETVQDSTLAQLTRIGDRIDDMDGLLNQLVEEGRTA